MDPTNFTPVDPSQSWRVSVDRAWRSAPVRRAFEHECGLAPLSSTEDGALKQALSGRAQIYQDRFMIWATKYLGLKDRAPATIRRQLD